MPKRGGKRPGAGRPRGSTNKISKGRREELAALARSYTKEAIATIVEIMESGQSEGARITAACVLLDRGYGKAVQAVGHSGDMKVEIEHSGAREKLARLIAGRLPLEA